MSVPDKFEVRSLASPVPEKAEIIAEFLVGVTIYEPPQLGKRRP